MSLLFTGDYANPSVPLWVPASGGTISGNLVVDGTITATQDVISLTGEVDGPSLRVIDSNAASKMILANDGAGNSLIQSTDVLKFTQLGTPNGNTTLTLSVAGANTDNFTLGGTLNCLIGPVPAQAITSSKVVNPVNVSPSAPSQYGVDNTITGISGAEYDVQAIATLYVVSGVPAATDLVNINVTIGGGQGNMSALLFPGATGVMGGFGVSGIGPLVAAGAAASVYMRCRLTPNASGTTLGANVLATLGGGSTAVYGSTLTILDVQRVR